MMPERICVCVKPVPADRGSRPPSLSPTDEHAIRAALLLREDAGFEVVVMAMAPPAAEGALRRSMALGADRAVLVSDDALGGSDLLVTSRVLARLVARESPALVLFGTASPDSGGAMLWSSVAARLGWPLLSSADTVTLRNGTAVIVRADGRARHIAQFRLPGVVALSGRSTSRPEIADIVRSKRQEVERVALSDLRLSPGEVGRAGSGTSSRRIEGGRAGDTVILAGPDAADRLFGILVQRGALVG
jgi:electron transfer flavoprotein beta subunit